MRSLQVQFPSGREVLASYWGFLHNGGLVLPEKESAGLTEGDNFVLDVKIKTLKQSYRFVARVVKKASPRTFVAFENGQDQEVMLNAAWADTHDVPQRKHRRYEVTREVRYATVEDPEKSVRGKIMNVSPGGCLLRSAAPLGTGARVRVSTQGLLLEGQVRWASAAGEMGIEFNRPDLVIQALLDRDSR